LVGQGGGATTPKEKNPFFSKIFTFLLLFPLLVHNLLSKIPKKERTSLDLEKLKIPLLFFSFFGFFVWILVLVRFGFDVLSSICSVVVALLLLCS